MTMANAKALPARRMRTKGQPIHIKNPTPKKQAKKSKRSFKRPSISTSAASSRQPRAPTASSQAASSASTNSTAAPTIPPPSVTHTHDTGAIRLPIQVVFRTEQPTRPTDKTDRRLGAQPPNRPHIGYNTTNQTIQITEATNGCK